MSSSFGLSVSTCQQAANTGSRLHNNRCARSTTGSNAQAAHKSAKSGALLHAMAERSRRPCHGTAHTDGEWVRRPEGAPYSASPHDLFKRFTASESAIDKAKLFGAAASLACSETPIALAEGGRKHYEWRPRRCNLDTFDGRAACALLDERGIRQITVVGDSVAGQFYLSLVMLLAGVEGFGPPIQNSTQGGSLHLHGKAATACDGRVRLSYARNDLLWWSNSGMEINTFRSCSGLASAALLHKWTARAVHDADLLVLSAGVHITAVLDGRSGPAIDALPAHNLRHTLHSVLEERATRYGMPSQSVVLLGAPEPLPGCEKHASPLTLTESLLMSEPKANRFGDQWGQIRLYNSAAQRLAEDLGVPFLDVAAMSHTRPDAAVGRFGLGHDHPDPLAIDCLHTCHPGPVDEYVRLLMHTIQETPQLRVPSPRTMHLRFFNMSEASWAKARDLEPIGSYAFLQPHLDEKYLCVSAARWFGPFVTCHYRGNSTRNTCRSRLDAKTLGSLLSFQGNTSST